MKFRFSVRGSDRRFCFHRGRPEPCAAEVVGDHAVAGGVFEGFNREIETGVEGQSSR